MSFVYTLEMLGTAAFAVSGALAASRKRMDIFGSCVLALMPAVGGGTIRDIIIDRVPVFWVSDNRYVAVAIIAALVVFFAPHRRPGIRRGVCPAHDVTRGHDGCPATGVTAPWEASTCGRGAAPSQTGSPARASRPRRHNLARRVLRTRRGAD